MKPTNYAGDSTHLYRQVYDDLEQQIATGSLRYQEHLPTLPELCRKYGVSAASVRRALDELERARLIVRQRGRGKGTIVIKRLLPNLTLRVLTMDDKLHQRPLEHHHEFFDILMGVREAAKEVEATLQTVSPSGFGSLPVPVGPAGYLIIGQGYGGYVDGAEMARQHECPFLHMNTPFAVAPCIRVDMERGAYLATNYLAQLGHRRIAYVGAYKGEWFGPRFDGYRRALEVNGLAFDEALVRSTGGVAREQDTDALDALLALPQAPTAIFACSDYRALHLLAACRERGISVPQQLSICGYDDIGEAADVLPAVTTIRHPRAELGRAAVEVLIRFIQEGEQPELDQVVEPQLIVRDSCAPPRR
jgi:DNA-binding LacI/PurR family transcriptional regulator/DNA-binding transcriptional regulator YhcF (GntR family)